MESLYKKWPFIYSMIGGAVGGFIFDDQQCDSLYNGWFRNFGVLNFINGDDASGMIQSFVQLPLQRSLFWSNILLLERQYS